MRYLVDTNIVSTWARKSSSTLMLKLAQAVLGISRCLLGAPNRATP